MEKKGHARKETTARGKKRNYGMKWETQKGERKLEKTSEEKRKKRKEMRRRKFAHSPIPILHPNTLQINYQLPRYRSLLIPPILLLRPLSLWKSASRPPPFLPRHWSNAPLTDIQHVRNPPRQLLLRAHSDNYTGCPRSVEFFQKGKEVRARGWV